MSIIRSLAFAAVVVASGAHIVSADTPKAPPAAEKKAPPPAASKDVTADQAKAFVKLVNDLVDVIVKNQDDCAKMTTGINGFIDQNQAMIDKANEAEKKGQTLPKEYQDQIEARMKKDMIPALTKKCGQDKGVQAALQRMGGKK